MTAAQIETALPGADTSRARESNDTVQWFGQSTRTVSGQADARYGWWPRRDGLCIVKAMDPALTGYAEHWLAYERRMLRKLAVQNAPVPQLVDVDRSQWLVTRFAGVSMRRLSCGSSKRAAVAHSPLQPLAPLEQLTVWVHLLYRLNPMAERGVLATDIYAPNVLVPLTETDHGQFQLRQPVLIDHAHTLMAGDHLERPSLIGDMQRLAPELRILIRQDIDAAVKALRARGANLPVDDSPSAAQTQINRQAWAEYRATLALQTMLDRCELNPAAAMQYAIGVALKQVVAQLPADQALVTVVNRMLTIEPEKRYTSLNEAAMALEQAVKKPLPFVSVQRCPKLQPDDLILPEARHGHARTTAPEPAEPLVAPGAMSQESADANRRPRAGAGTGRGQRTASPRLKLRERGPASRWTGWAVALGSAGGGAVGVLLPDAVLAGWWGTLQSLVTIFASA